MGPGCTVAKGAGSTGYQNGVTVPKLPKFLTTPTATALATRRDTWKSRDATIQTGQLGTWQPREVTDDRPLQCFEVSLLQRICQVWTMRGGGGMD